MKWIIQLLSDIVIKLVKHYEKRTVIMEDSLPVNSRIRARIIQRVRSAESRLSSQQRDIQSRPQS